MSTEERTALQQRLIERAVDIRADRGCTLTEAYRLAVAELGIEAGALV